MDRPCVLGTDGEFGASKRNIYNFRTHRAATLNCRALSFAQNNVLDFGFTMAPLNLFRPTPPPPLPVPSSLYLRRDPVSKMPQPASSFVNNKYECVVAHLLGRIATLDTRCNNAGRTVIFLGNDWKYIQIKSLEKTGLGNRVLTRPSRKSSLIIEVSRCRITSFIKSDKISIRLGENMGFNDDSRN